MIHQSSIMVMAFDGNSYNWNAIAGSTGISGRHGAAANSGKDEFFSCAFFDGHVMLLPTEPSTVAGNLSCTPGDAVSWLYEQK